MGLSSFLFKLVFDDFIALYNHFKLNTYLTFMIKWLRTISITN